MKRIIYLTTFLIISISTNILGQNVGIGEPNPSEKLEVNGRVAAKGYKNTILSAEGSTQVGLNASQTWTAVPDLTHTFTLSEPTTVIASYGVTLQLSANPGGIPDASLALVIDGDRVAPCLNTVTDAGHKAHFANQHIAELSAGTHTITVEYYFSPAGPYISAPNGSTGNWERKLQVLIFGSN